MVGSRVSGGRFLSNPEHRGGDEFFPMIEGFFVFEGVGRCRHNRHLRPVLGCGRGDQERGEDDGERSQVAKELAANGENSSFSGN